MEQRIKSLTKEAKYELFHYPVTTKKQDIKYWVKRLLRPKHTPKRDSFFWTHALLTQALESVGETETLKKYYDAWIEKDMPVHHLDNIMNGYTLLYVYEKTGEEKYRKAADELYKYVCDYVKELGNPMPYRKNHPTHVYVDALGMITPFLCRYGNMFQKMEAIVLGRKQIVDFLEYGMDMTTGLPYHGYDTKSGVKQGIIGWGRAVGWLMLAMADSVEYLPDTTERKELLESFDKLTKKVLSYQRNDGYISWQLQAMEGPKDTSTTAMIGYAVKKVWLLRQKEKQAVQMEEKAENLFNNLSDREVRRFIEQAEKALLASYRDGKIYDCSGECEGFSQYPQVYGAYPWSLGPGLRLLHKI